MSSENNLLEKLVSLCKRRGFFYQGSEIYGGLAGTWDYAPYGVALKNNIKQLWWKRFVLDREDMYGFDAAILMNQSVWEASGHTGAGFSDPLVECQKCKRRFRADHLRSDNHPRSDLSESPRSDLNPDLACPECGGALSEERQFNMMFRTHVGATEDEDSISYLRPETAQGMFVNFKNIIDSFHPKLPFGMAQTGKAFRNEIAPRNFLFRTREFEQMEIEYFVAPDNWEDAFEEFQKHTREFFEEVGVDMGKVHEVEMPENERAHYSERTIDFEFDYPFGRDELSGLAYRTDFDLAAHEKGSTEELKYVDPDTGEKFIPHVIEPSFGVERLMLALLTSAYREDELGGEKRVFLKFNPAVAPIKVAIFPLLKNKPQLVEKAREVYALMKSEFGAVLFDDNGNIGKRYRRQDEIGTPYCVTIDFETLEKDDCVTVRDRDSGAQERIAVSDLAAHMNEKLNQ